MDRWTGILKVPLYPNSNRKFKVAASLCLSSASKTLTVPSANAIFFSGDRVEGTGNPLIERLSNPEKIAEILISKLGGSINAWVIEASTFNGSFAVYKDFIPSVNRSGEPKSYNPSGFPSSASTVLLLSNCLKEIKNLIPGRHLAPYQDGVCESTSHQTPRTLILGFSKGGTVLNQLVTELCFSEVKFTDDPSEHPLSGAFPQEENQITPNSKEILLNSISEIHYVDVGLNSAGAYLTDSEIISRITKRLVRGAPGVRFVLHGTPRQWSDNWRVWIRDEKNKMLQLLESESRASGGKLSVCERFYFAGKPPTLQMHFEIIENLDLS